MNIFFASAQLGFGFSVGYSSATITGLTIAVVILALLGRHHRSRRLSGGFPDTPPARGMVAGIVGTIFSAAYMFAELIAFVCAWLAITHAPSLIVGVALGVVFGVILASAAYSQIARQTKGVFRSLWEWVRESLTKTAIVAIVGLAVGFIYGGIGGGLLFVGIVVGIIAGRDGRASAKRDQTARMDIATSLAAALGVSASALDEVEWYVTSDGSIVIERPGGLLLNASRLEERVATLMPRLEVSEASPQRIVLSPLSVETSMSRAHAQRSDGLVTGTTDASTTPNVTPAAPVTDANIPEHTIGLEDL